MCLFLEKKYGANALSFNKLTTVNNFCGEAVDKKYLTL